MMQKSESIAALAAALAQANLEMANPTFDKRNSHFNNGYASLAAVLNAIRQPLAKQGLSLVQTISSEPGLVIITTSLLHKSGEWLSAEVAVSVPQNATAQAVGGATGISTFSATTGAPLASCGRNGWRLVGTAIGRRSSRSRRSSSASSSSPAMPHMESAE